MSHFLKWLMVVIILAISIVAAAFALPAKKSQSSQPAATQQPVNTPAVNPHEKMEPLIHAWVGEAPKPVKPIRVLTREQSFFDDLYKRAIPSPDVRFGISPKSRAYTRVTAETLPFQVMAQKSFPNGRPRAIWIEQLKMRAVVIPMADECNVTLYEFPTHVEICFLSVRYEQYANVGFVKTVFSLDTPRDNRESVNTAHRFVWEKVQEMDQIDAGMIDPEVSMAFETSTMRMHVKPGHLKQVDMRQQVEIFDQLYRKAPEHQHKLYSVSTQSFFSALIHMPMDYPVQRLVKADGEAYIVVKGPQGKNTVLAKRRLMGVNYIQVVEAVPGSNAGSFAHVAARLGSDAFIIALATPVMQILEQVPPPPPVQQPTDFSNV